MYCHVEHDSPFSSHATSLTLLIRIRSMFIRVPKQDFSKCAEYVTGKFVEVKFGRCLRTNFIHIFRCSFAGNLGIDIIATRYVLVQLPNPGPPQAQNFPLLALFVPEAMLVKFEIHIVSQAVLLLHG